MGPAPKGRKARVGRLMILLLIYGTECMVQYVGQSLCDFASSNSLDFRSHYGLLYSECLGRLSRLSPETL
jgi:hypothetical protein